jgi:hypothetical protein
MKEQKRQNKTWEGKVDQSKIIRKWQTLDEGDQEDRWSAIDEDGETEEKNNTSEEEDGDGSKNKGK